MGRLPPRWAVQNAKKSGGNRRLTTPESTPFEEQEVRTVAVETVAVIGRLVPNHPQQSERLPPMMKTSFDAGSSLTATGAADEELFGAAGTLVMGDEEFEEAEEFGDDDEEDEDDEEFEDEEEEFDDEEEFEDEEFDDEEFDDEDDLDDDDDEDEDEEEEEEEY